MASKCMNIQIKIYAIMKSWKCVKKSHEIHEKSIQNESPKPPQRGPRHPKRAQRCPRGFQKAPKSDKGALRGGAGVDLVAFYSSKWEPKCIPEAARASKMSPEASQKRPKGVQEHHLTSIQTLFLNKSWTCVPECIQKHARIHEISNENRHGFECAQTWNNIVKL